MTRANPPLTPKEFSSRVVDWYHQHGRQHLPWQQTRTPYRVWISEIMLQQTQVTTVIPYFERFMSTFPDVHALALAHIDTVLQHWSGLGYYARGRNLHKAAQIIHSELNGEFPRTIEGLCELPGIGRSTAGAILSFGYGISAPILDGNVKRTLSRYAGVPGWPGLPAVAKNLWEIAENYTPTTEIQAYTQAMMDLGAMICTRTQPKCETCPLQSACVAFHTERIADFPGKKPSRNKPVKHTYVLLLTRADQKILLEQRPPVGIWGGLWSLPECHSLDDIPHFSREKLGLTVEPQDFLPEFRHTFSHYHLDISPVVCRVMKTSSRVAMPGPHKWVESGQLSQYGLPAPIKFLLSSFLQEQNA